MTRRLDQASIQSGMQLTRRELVHIGALGSVGLALPRLLSAAPSLSGLAKSCILFFLEGGPSHIDLWDLKPEAPANVRGEFAAIDSSLPGVPVCEHLPMLAKQMRHFALVRSVHHGVVDHNAGAYYMLTGRTPVDGGKLIVRPEANLFPTFGSVLAHLQPSKSVPEFVHIPDIMSNNGYDLPGEFAGFLGTNCDPFVTGDPSARNYEVPGLGLPKGVTKSRLELRHHLLTKSNIGQANFADTPDGQRLDTQYAKAYSLLASRDVRAAFDLSQESESLRQRYGYPDRVDRSVEARKFGGLPHLGQSMLLARRLIESGVRLVTVCTGRRIDQAWDTHRDHFPLLKKALLPYVDRAFSALMEDMSERGMLEDTLVVAMGEFGRTPRLGQITSGAGADAAGRDHWPHCYTVLFAGGGIQPGIVFGESDEFAAYPKTNPVTPEDIAATIYSALGLDPHQQIRDGLNRPYELAIGQPIIEILKST
jgi:hypothetical protein